MEKRIITILKKEDRLMSLSEIVSELNKKTESSIKDEDVRPILKKLCEKNIISIGNEVEAHFGDEANPLYERLAKFFQVLDSYGFIYWKD